jgi:hypothetical protein
LVFPRFDSPRFFFLLMDAASLRLFMRLHGSVHGSTRSYLSGKATYQDLAAWSDDKL